ncbi:MAG: TrkA family potassium uptake protein [Deltaproteobacteria bacterium]|nr:TrkA family potassium uptake protein [Deltaproteobacteria bacterium]
MNKQAIVIGLGQFGMSLARTLTGRGVEVLAVESRPELVRIASGFVAEAVCFDATDEESLARTAPGRRDFSVCGIGDESREASIICVALLRQMGAPRIIARASDPLHERILHLVGAHEVVNPEREFGERFANRLIYERVVGELPLGDDLVITELTLPPAFIGHTLADLGLPRRYGVTVVAVRRPGKATVVVPNPSEPLNADDIIVVVSRGDAVHKLVERV